MITTTHEYYLIIKEMSNEELVDEYRALLLARKQGADVHVNLQPRFDIVSNEAKTRDFNIKAFLYSNPEEHKVLGDVEMIECPDSTSIGSFGYDDLGKILYIKYKSGETVYSYANVPPEIFEQMQKADSKGKFVAKNVKGRFKSP